MPRSAPRNPDNPASKRAVLLTDDDYANMSIWQAMARMSPDDWSDKELFVYRLSPRTVNRDTGDHSYIEKRLTGLDEQTLKAMFRGGTFQLILNANTPSRRTLYKATVKIPGSPVLLKDEVVVTKEDSSASSLLPAPAGVSVEDMIRFAHTVREISGQENPKPQNEAFGAALNLVAQGAQRGMEITASQAQKSGLSSEKLLELVLTSRERQDPATKQLMNAVLARALNPPPAPSLKEKLEEVKQLEELVGSGRRGSDSTWSLVAQVASKFAESIPALIQAFQNRNARIVTPIYPPHLQPSQISAPPTPIQAIDPITLVKAKLIRSFVDGDDGHFVGWLLEKEAPSIFSALKGKTVEDVKEFLSGDPSLREMIGQQGLDEFIGEILEYAASEQAATEQVQ